MKELLGNNKKFFAITLFFVGLTSLSALILPYLVQFVTQENVQWLTFLSLSLMLFFFVLQIGLLMYREKYATSLNSRHQTILLLQMKRLDYSQLVEREPTSVKDRRK